MFDEARTGRKEALNKEELDQIWGPKHAIADHNKYLDDYYESLDPNEEGSLIKGLEDLKCDRNDTHDYVDDDFISWNGTLYALKVNSFNIFLSFMNLLKKDRIVFKHWEVFSRKYVDMMKWFYLVYLNYDHLDEIPASIGVIKIDLLALHKMVDSLGGYVTVSLSGKWATIAHILGLTTEDEDAIKACFKKFIDVVIVYHNTAQIPWMTEKPKFEEGESSWTAEKRNPQGLDGLRVGDGQGEPGLNRLGVEDEQGMKQRNEVGMEQRYEDGSNEDDSDFDVIV